MTRYKKEEIERFLHKKYKKNIKLEPVAVGMDSQVYAYEFQKQKYIIRINEKLEGFKKDEYAYNNFRSDIIKIPRIIEYGNFNNDYYCISERINGITFQDASSSLINNLLAKVVNVLNSINSVDISKTTGYGVFDSTTGNANYNTWKEFLLDIFSSDYNFNLIKEKKYVDNDLLEKLFKKRKTILSFYQNRLELFDDAELKSLIRNTNYCIVDSKHKISLLEDYVEKKLPIVDITPFDTRADFGISQQLTVQNILVPIDTIEQSKFEELIVLFASYFETNETARVHFFTRNANWDRVDSILNFTCEVLKVNGLDERLARKETNDKAEFDLDGDKIVPIKFFVDQCVDELSISKCMREQRIMVDLTSRPDLYLQISCISSAIPQIVSFNTQYVHDGKNGFIVKEVSEVLNGLKYYLDNITNWNKCMIYSYELGKEYNTASLIRKWKGVMKQVEQD